MSCRTLPDYKWPARFAAWWFAPVRWVGAAAFVLGRLLGRACAAWEPRAAADISRILVIRTDGLGDAVLFEPAMRSLASRYPRHALHLWAPAPTCELFRAAPFIRHFLSIPRGCKTGNLHVFTSPRLRFRLGYATGKWQFDLAVYAVESPEPLGNWLLASARASEKLAADGDHENQFSWQAKLACGAATRVLTRRPGGGHELLRNAHFAAAWGADVSRERPKIYSADAPSQIAHARARLWRDAARQRGAAMLIGVIPAGTVAANTYPAPSWAAVLRELWQTHRALPAFLGSQAEAAHIAEILALLPDVPALTIGATIDIVALALLLPQLDGVISVDTGPAHLALALRVPTVVLCGGGHPRRFFPWPGATSAVVLNQPMPCEGCFARCHLPQPECLTGIPPTDVVEALLHISSAAATDREAA